jgi:hypothetical protein
MGPRKTGGRVRGARWFLDHSGQVTAWVRCLAIDRCLRDSERRGKCSGQNKGMSGPPSGSRRGPPTPTLGLSCHLGCRPIVNALHGQGGAGKSCVRPVGRGERLARLAVLTYVNVHARASAELQRSWQIGVTTMAVQRLKSVIVGVLLGLALLSMSAPASAYGQRSDRHPAVTVTSPVRVELPPRVVGGHVLPTRVLSSEAPPGDASGPRSAMSSRQAFGVQAAFKASSAPKSSCGHPEGCACGGANGACCGMTCCAMALVADTPTLACTDGPVLAAPPSALLEGTPADTLLRPPRAMA